VKHSGGVTRPLPRNGDVEELHGDPTVGPRSGPEIKNGRSGAEDGALERLGCGTVKVRSCRRCPQALHEEFSFLFILHR